MTINRLAIRVVALLALAYCVPRSIAGTGGERRVNWDGLAAIVGRQVRVVMPDGAHIEGSVTGLETDALAVDIHKTSNRKAYPKGHFLLPRATLRAVDVVERSSKHWRIVCVALGGGIGYLAARAAINSSKGSGPGVGGIGLGTLAAGLPVGGYLLGNAADRRVTTYVITP
jgi:hypothetical protein